MNLFPRSYVLQGKGFTLCLFFLLVGVIPVLRLPAQGLVRPFHYQHSFHKENSLYLNATEFQRDRKRWVTGIATGGYVASMIYLGAAWYSQEDLTHFHFHDDWRNWKQMDKMGHMLGGYHATKWMIDLNKWSGMEKKKALRSGALFGFLSMSSIEVFDGFGAQWGASLTDVGANFLGASLAYGNQALWNENRIQLKFSYLKSSYAGVPEHAEIFGTSLSEWILKDYNGQTYWLSARVHSFLPEGSFKEKYPRWLNVAVGYGAQGLEGKYSEEPWEVIQAREYRQYYVGLDIDLSNIKTQSGFLNALLNVASIIKVPLPALEVDKNGVRVQAFR